MSANRIRDFARKIKDSVKENKGPLTGAAIVAGGIGAGVLLNKIMDDHGSDAEGPAILTRRAEDLKKKHKEESVKEIARLEALARKKEQEAYDKMTPGEKIDHALKKDRAPRPEVERKKAEVDAFQKELEEIQKRLAALETDLDAKEKTIAEQRETIGKQQREIAELSTEITRKETQENDKIEAVRKGQDVELLKVRTELAKWKEDATNFQRAHEKASAALAAERAKVRPGAEGADVANLKGKIANLEAQLSKANGEVEQLRKREAELLATIERLKGELESARSRTKAPEREQKKEAPMPEVPKAPKRFPESKKEKFWNFE